MKPPILVVDDVEANLVAMEAILEGMGCELALARSGNEALKLLLKRDFAAILLDVQMPGMDGYEVAGHARSNPLTRQVPIIFLTAKDNTDDDALRGYGTGAVDFLFKPISAVVLRSKVRVFLELHERNAQMERAYLELKHAQNQLVQSAKMAALGELVAGVAHEINNPLAFVMSHLKTAQNALQQTQPNIAPHLLADDLRRWDKAAQRLSDMHVGLDRISDLVTQLRTFSRLDEGERKVIDFAECLDSVLMILGHRLTEGIHIERNLKGPAKFECYPGPLNLALLNLVANALDAIESDGHITISTDLHDGQLIIAVSDDGMGISVENQVRIFEPFFTTKAIGKGTGLGLSMSYSIAQRHGGILSVSSAVGKGTTMTITFPLSLQRTE